MQIASKQPLWRTSSPQTRVEFEFTASTGRQVRLYFSVPKGGRVRVSWGDGTCETVTQRPASDKFVWHTYPSTGKFVATFNGTKGWGFGFRDYWGESFSFDRAIISVVDCGGKLGTIPSGAFIYASRLKRFIAPGATWVGEKSFDCCTSLEEVVLGNVGYHYDYSFRDCSSLVSYRAKGSGTCWRACWRGCSRIRALYLGTVRQFGPMCFKECPKLEDIWIDGKTVEQISQVAPEGNIVCAYDSHYPWSANASCRFHGTNGIVLGDGTIIHR